MSTTEDVEVEPLLHGDPVPPTRTPHKSIWDKLLGDSSPVCSISSYESLYGNRHPAFQFGRYSTAVSLARSQHKLLCVYIHGDDHDDTYDFCMNTLADSGVIDMLARDYITYACSTRSMHVLNLLDTFKVTQIPFVCIIDRDKHELGRACGLTDAASLLSLLQECSTSSTSTPAQPISSVSSILAQQDREYEMALQRDRERMRSLEESKRVAEESARDRARESVEMQERLASALERREAMIEPDKGERVATVQIRLPGGASVRRRFRYGDKLEVLADFVDTFELVTGDGVKVQNWEFVTNFPTLTYKLEQTLEQAGLVPQATLFVREIV